MKSKGILLVSSRHFHTLKEILQNLTLSKNQNVFLSAYKRISAVKLGVFWKRDFNREKAMLCR